jgi:arsenate reductase
MAYAFAQRAIAARGLSEDVALLTGGTRPAEHVHAEVVEAMAETGIDISDRTPREITFEEIQQSDYVVTMGCSADDVCPAGWAGENRDWALEDPDGKPPAAVGEIRDEIETRVTRLLDDVAHDR